MSEDIQHIVLWLIPAAPLLAAIVTALLGPKLLRYRVICHAGRHWQCLLFVR